MDENPLLYLINKYPDKDWDLGGISQNPNITMEDIENNLDKPWNWECISRNPNLTLDFVIKYINNINVQNGNKMSNAE